MLHYHLLTYGEIKSVGHLFDAIQHPNHPAALRVNRSLNWVGLTHRNLPEVPGYRGLYPDTDNPLLLSQARSLTHYLLDPDTKAIAGEVGACHLLQRKSKSIDKSWLVHTLDRYA